QGTRQPWYEGTSRMSGGRLRHRERKRARHLPARCDPAARDPERCGKLSHVDSPAMSSVLIIDDHPIVLQAWRRMLQDAGVTDIFDARAVACVDRLVRPRCT